MNWRCAKTEKWFRECLGAPTAVQQMAWPAIASGEHVLVSAPTGAGKTLAAFLALLDGMKAEDEAGALQDGLRVILTLDGQEIANLPFGEAHTVRVLQENGDENTLVLTGESVYMESANCEGQDCVHMEPVTRNNLETRVMSGMIICLPHRFSVEVR